MTFKRRLIRTLILSSLAVCAGAIIALVSLMLDGKGASSSGVVNAAAIGGPYTLTDQNGQTRTNQDFRDRYKLLYFGFSYCPAICPTELQKIATALKALPKDLQEKIQPLFITIDPERDTPAQLKSYVALFDPRLIGLTGTPEQIDAVKKAYKVYAAKVPPEDGAGKDEYTMDHSSFIYFLTPDDKLLLIFRTEDTAAQMADKIKAQFGG